MLSPFRPALCLPSWTRGGLGPLPGFRPEGTSWLRLQEGHTVVLTPSRKKALQKVTHDITNLELLPFI